MFTSFHKVNLVQTPEHKFIQTLFNEWNNFRQKYGVQTPYIITLEKFLEIENFIKSGKVIIGYQYVSDLDNHWSYELILKNFNPEKNISEHELISIHINLSKSSLGSLSMNFGLASVYKFN